MRMRLRRTRARVCVCVCVCACGCVLEWMRARVCVGICRCVRAGASMLARLNVFDQRMPMHTCNGCLSSRCCGFLIEHMFGQICTSTQAQSFDELSSHDSMANNSRNLCQIGALAKLQLDADSSQRPRKTEIRDHRNHFCCRDRFELNSRHTCGVSWSSCRVHFQLNPV